MNKKKRITILFAVILVVAVGIIIAVTSHQKKEMDFDEFADRFEKSAENVILSRRAPPKQVILQIQNTRRYSYETER